MTIVDLEQEILKFSSIMEDVELIEDDADASAVSRVYARRFDRLWHKFEEHSKEHHKLREDNSKLTAKLDNSVELSEQQLWSDPLNIVKNSE